MLTRPSLSAPAGGVGGLWPPEMGRAGAGFLDSAMKFGYAKREHTMSMQSPNSQSKASILMMNLTQIMKISTKMQII